MVAERARIIHPVPLAAHHLKEVVERGLHNVENIDNKNNCENYDNDDNDDNDGNISRKWLKEACK